MNWASICSCKSLTFLKSSRDMLDQKVWSCESDCSKLIILSLWLAQSNITNQKACGDPYSLRYAFRSTMLQSRVEFVMLKYACASF